MTPDLTPHALGTVEVKMPVRIEVVAVDKRGNVALRLSYADETTSVDSVRAGDNLYYTLCLDVHFPSRPGETILEVQERPADAPPTAAPPHGTPKPARGV